MANQEKEKQSQSTPGNGTLQDAAKIAKSVGRIAAGDMTAIKDLLTNKTFWEFIISFLLIISLLASMTGGFIAAIIEYIGRVWAENWDENWEEAAIESNGNKVNLKTWGWMKTAWRTIGDSASELWNTVTGKGVSDGAGRDNAGLYENGQAADYNPTAQDFADTVDSVTKQDKLTATVQRRLDMIKGRVSERGKQLQKAVKEQYTKGKLFETTHVEGIKNWIDKRVDSDRIISDDGSEIVLFAGYDGYMSDDNVTVDVTVFQLTDLQALKILAIFCIQNDCQLEEVDMWSLMDYCGWFDNNEEYAPLDDYADNDLYAEILPTISLGTDIAGIGHKDDVIMGIELPSLQVPLWEGTCAPQWYYEEIAQIKEHNSNLAEGEEPWGVNAQWNSITYQLQSEFFPVLTVAQEVQDEYGPVTANDSIWYYYKFCAINMETGNADAVVCIGEGQSTTAHFNGEPVKDYLFTGLLPGADYEIHYYLCVNTPKDEGTVYPDGGSYEYATKWGYYDPELNNITEIRYEGYLEAFTTNELYGNTSSESVNIENFFKLSNVETFGIIDKLFYTVENNITINQEEFNTNQDWTREDLENLSSFGFTFNGEEVADIWERYYWESVSEQETTGYIVGRTAEGEHYITINYNAIPGNTVEFSRDGKTSTVTRNYIMLYKVIKYGITAGSDELEFIGSLDVGKHEDTFHWLEGDGVDYSIYIYTVQTRYNIGSDGLPDLDNGKVIKTEEKSISNLTTLRNKRDIVIYGLYTSVDVKFEARTVDDIAYDLLGIWPGDLRHTIQVTHYTQGDGNYSMIGQNTTDDSYYYCMKGGNYILLDKTSGAPTLSIDGNENLLRKLFRSKNNSTTVEPLITTTTIYEYGISNIGKKITKVNQIPASGWHMAQTDGDRLVFKITPMLTYYAYARVTVITTELLEDGTTKTEYAQYLYQMDKFNTSDARVSNGAQYATGQLGNDLLLSSWTDVYRDAQAGSYSHMITLERQQGYQYESYVDMVMALSKLLNLNYDSWDPAVKRAEELGIRKVWRCPDCGWEFTGEMTDDLVCAGDDCTTPGSDFEVVKKIGG